MADDLFWIQGRGLVPASELRRSMRVEEVPCGHALETIYSIEGQQLRTDQTIIVDPAKVPGLKGEIGWLPEMKLAAGWERFKSLLGLTRRR